MPRCPAGRHSRDFRGVRALMSSLLPRIALIAAWVGAASAAWELVPPPTCGSVTRLRAGAPSLELAPGPDGGVVPRILGEHRSLDAGQPDLPFLARLVPVPLGCEARIEIVMMESVETNVPPIRPVARREARREEDGRRWLERVAATPGPAYTEDAFWPSDTLSISYASQGTQRWARIIFRPLQYNPIRGILRWNRSLDARLHWQAEPASE